MKLVHLSKSEYIQQWKMNKRTQSKKIKEDNKLPNTRNTAYYMYFICKYILYFQVFAVFAFRSHVFLCYVHMYFHSCTTPN